MTPCNASKQELSNSIRSNQLYSYAGHAYVVLATMTLQSSKPNQCPSKSILHLTNWSLPGRAVDPLNEAKIFCLLNLLQLLTFHSRGAFAVEKHGNRLFLVDAHAFGGSKEAKRIKLALQ